MNCFSLSRPRLLPACAAGLAAVALLATTTVPGHADWNGTEAIDLGDKVTATFEGGSVPELHQYRFFATAETKLTATAKAAKKTDLMPALALMRGNGVLVDLGTSLVNNKKGTAPKIKKFILPTSGYYLIQVSATSGTGEYKLTTSGKYPGKQKDESLLRTYTFAAGADSLLNASLKTPKKGLATNPTFTTLTGPNGPIAITPLKNGKKLKKVPLPDDGVYTIEYTADAPGELKVTVQVKTPKGKEKIEQTEVQNTTPMGSIDLGDPDGPAKAGYVGTNSCRTCHADYFDNVANSFHNSKMRMWAREGAAGYNVPPAIDAMFKATGGTDLVATEPAVFGTLNGLSISHDPTDALPYKVTIGTGASATTHDVMYVMGGNGLWKQRYVVKIGRSHYISPVQFNEKTQTFAAYHPEHWYDTAGNGDPIPMATPNSWERRCGACHSTGLELTYDAPSGEYRTGYAEMNVGCEACHGPGEAHITSMSKDDILNPRDLVDGTVEGVQTADLVCGQCHHRGDGGTPTGAPKATGYPWSEANGIYTPGVNDFLDYYTLTGASSFWLYEDRGTPTDRTDDTFLSSKKHHQQYPDIQQGPHAPDKLYDGVCFDCHNPHANKDRKHMITDTLTRGQDTITGIENDNNKLCLTCHKGHGDFTVLTAADVQAITDDSAPGAVAQAVVEHMRDKSAMPVGVLQYDPAGSSAVGRCSKCHMPKMAKSAVWVPDAEGHLEGDIHSHTFYPVWPNISVLENGAITNSCNTCHPLDLQDGVDDIINAWANDPDSDGTFHASVVRGFQNGVANHNRNGGVACAACHTTKGFIDIQVNGDLHDLTDDTEQADRDELISFSLQRGIGITCQACHGRQSDGTFALGENPLRFPKAELCGKCHNNETVLLSDFVADGEIVRHPHREMNAGVDGGEVPTETYSDSVHTSAGLTCVDCHFQMDDGGDHSFEPTLATCNAVGCHANTPLSDFNRTARADYDGLNGVEGIQDEIAGSLQILQESIVAASAGASAPITYAAPYFLIDGDRSNTAALDPGDALDAALMRAIFNHYWVSFDGSGGVHNTEYALQLIQKSYEEINGPSSWPGVTR